MLLDIQGSSYKLYDPEIATTDLFGNDASLGSKELNICAGNLSFTQATLHYFWFISKFFLYLVLNEEAEFDCLMLQSIVSHICDAAN